MHPRRSKHAPASAVRLDVHPRPPHRQRQPGPADFKAPVILAQAQVARAADRLAARTIDRRKPPLFARLGLSRGWRQTKPRSTHDSRPTGASHVQISGCCDATNTPLLVTSSQGSSTTICPLSRIVSWSHILTGGYLPFESLDVHRRARRPESSGGRRRQISRSPPCPACSAPNTATLPRERTTVPDGSIASSCLTRPERSAAGQ